jgi:pimeloyl-ACP methyl ester carboxylesterase
MTKVDAGGYEVHANVIAGDDPPVVAVSAMGTDSSQWLPVLARLTARTTMITYDRPGIGLSPPRPAPNPAQPYRTFADELATILKRLGVATAVVAVGHSFGSLIVRSFAARHPHRIAGMVHIDGSKPALTLWPGDGPPVDGNGAHATWIDAARGAAELSGASLPDVPGVVLTRTPGRWNSLRADQTVDRSWQEHQAELARQCRAPLIVATDSGHDIPGEAPDLVALAIDEVVRAVRGRHPCAILDPIRVHAAGGDLSMR